MKKVKLKMKRGVASFYIVAFSTLIMVIVAASFATVIISEVTRTSNDDLSQSAYDSALAGVEDAKLAYANYRRCLAEGYSIPAGYKPDLANDAVTCNDIIYWMQNPDCDMVGHMIGRIGKAENKEVVVSDTVYIDAETAVESNLNQAYTCVKINTQLSDYRANLTATEQLRVIKAEFEPPASAANVKRVRLRWYTTKVDVNYCFSNMVGAAGDGCAYSATATNWRTAFQPVPVAQPATPPTLEVQLIQTASTFSLADFDEVDGDKTDRATIYLVPTDSATAAGTRDGQNYQGVWENGANTVSAAQIAKTNNQTIRNVPYAVYCPVREGSGDDTTDEFACTVDLVLPEPVGAGGRNNDTFMLVVSLPYGQPDTDFALEFWCSDGAMCHDAVVAGSSDAAQAYVSSSQVSIDSTGRANDLYRRVEVRLESANTSFAYPEYAVQLMGNTTGTDTVVSKDLTVTHEYNFYR